MSAIAPGPENSTVTVSEKGWVPCKTVLGNSGLASVVKTVRFERQQAIGTTLIWESLIRLGHKNRPRKPLYTKAYKSMAHTTPKLRH